MAGKNDAEHDSASIPYLFADPELVARWQAKLANFKGFRIGVNWHGREGTGPFRQRDIPRRCFEELAAVPGVCLISLQKTILAEPHSGAISDERGQAIAELGKFDECGAFMDTAAIMKNVDLVITSDTSIAHLAGALGVPVWVGLPYSADWRWLLNRTDSPWYPSMRLFRQPQTSDWTSVFAAIKNSLAASRILGKGG